LGRVNRKATLFGITEFSSEEGNEIVKVLFSWANVYIKGMIIYKRKISILAAFHDVVNDKVVTVVNTHHSMKVYEEMEVYAFLT
jgi:hypothetical protein